MKWVEIEGQKFRYVETSNLNWISGLDDNGEETTYVQSPSPLTLVLSPNSPYFKFFKSFKKSEHTDEHFSSEILPKWIKNLLANKTTEEEQLKEKESALAALEKKQRAELEHTYDTKNAEFEYYLKEYDMTPLEFIVSVARCLCADSVREVIRAFIGFFLTYKGFRATNVIAIGSASAGKSFILETALSMCPQEKVNRGIMSSASFFREFDGMNLDGWVFYLGDLGGDKSDEKTIAFRDILKELTTDGEVYDTIAKDNSDTETIRRKVTGRPAIWYTTAKEEIVNEQEKSRSIILTPQDVDPTSLVIFNTIWENNGSFRNDLDELRKMRDSVKGFVYNYRKKDQDFYNPYMFCVKDALSETDDFNRKIQEFTATLNVISLLSDPSFTEHEYYLDEVKAKKSTEIIFNSKRDNLNAINLFDAVNFLPDEARFGDELLARYKLFDFDELGIEYDESKTYEENIMLMLKSSEYGFQDLDREFAPNSLFWRNEYAYNVDNGYINSNYEDFKDNWFTVSILKKRFSRNKWFKKNRAYVSERLLKLTDENILLKLGKDGKENVYCLNAGNGSKISEKLPDFSDKFALKQSRQLFEILFPRNVLDYDEFVSSDDECDDTNLTESIPAMFPQLPYIRGDTDV